VFTYAGSGRLGSNLGSGDVSDLGAPAGLANAGPGKLLVSDTSLNVIRLITR